MKLKFSLSLFFILLYACFQAVFAHETFEENNGLGFNFQIQNSTDSLTTLKKQIGAFAKKKDYVNAIILSKKLLKRAEYLSDSSYINNAIWRQGFYYKRMDQLDSAYYYFDKSYTVNLKLKDSIGAGERLLDMANIQKSLGDYNGGMITAIDGLKYLESSKEIKSISGLYQTISVCQKELGNFKEALRWNNELQYSRAICNMGYYKWLENKNNPESELLLLNALHIREELNTVSGLISSTIHLAEYYFETNKPKALAYAQNAYTHSKKLNNSVAILESLDLVLPLKKALGQDVSEEAILYSNVQNKLEKTKQAVRSIYAATKYDNDTLEKKNLTLLAEVATKEKQNILALSAALFLLVVIGFVIYYKNQQKKREQLEMAYKTELRLSKKLHDELGNDVFYLMTQVQKDNPELGAPKNSMILDGLHSIYQRIRDISKEFTAITTGEGFGNQFSTLLNSYGSNKTKLITKELAADFWDPISPKAKIEIYRVLQELLVNMKKHSNASLVAITCTQKKRQVTIKYVDNGVGFNLKENYLGNGLKNAENRINAIKGTINFDSKPNKGFTATITFAI